MPSPNSVAAPTTITTLGLFTGTAAPVLVDPAADPEVVGVPLVAEPEPEPDPEPEPEPEADAVPEAVGAADVEVALLPPVALLYLSTTNWTDCFP
jgi:hypothetical protein